MTTSLFVSFSAKSAILIIFPMPPIQTDVPIFIFFFWFGFGFGLLVNPHRHTVHY